MSSKEKTEERIEIGQEGVELVQNGLRRLLRQKYKFSSSHKIASLWTKNSKIQRIFSFPDGVQTLPKTFTHIRSNKTAMHDDMQTFVNLSIFIVTV